MPNGFFRAFCKLFSWVPAFWREVKCLRHVVFWPELEKFPFVPERSATVDESGDPVEENRSDVTTFFNHLSCFSDELTTVGMTSLHILILNKDFIRFNQTSINWLRLTHTHTRRCKKKIFGELHAEHRQSG